MKCAEKIINAIHFVFSRKDVRSYKTASWELRFWGRKKQVILFWGLFKKAWEMRFVHLHTDAAALYSRLSVEDLEHLNEDGELWFAYEGLKKATRLVQFFGVFTTPSYTLENEWEGGWLIWECSTEHLLKQWTTTTLCGWLSSLKSA